MHHRPRPASAHAATLMSAAAYDTRVTKNTPPVNVSARTATAVKTPPPAHPAASPVGEAAAR